MSRVVAIIDGEHYPPVVRDALAALSAQHEVVAAVFAGGTEKVAADANMAAYGVPVLCGASPEAALAAAIDRHAPDEVVDLSDEPVLSSADRFRLASVALGRGVLYRGADFRLSPADTSAATRTPTLAIAGTGKRVGKTAVSAHAARTFTAAGHDVVVLAMGRGGPEQPDIIRGDLVAPTTADLLALARAGVHAASDNYEEAVMARVTTVGCRRCGGGLAGAVFFSNVVEGAALADGLGRDLLILEGSGSAIPPVHADATVLVVGAAQGPGYVTDYLGPLRIRSADLVVVSGAEAPVASPERVAETLAAVRDLAPGVPIIPVVFRPRPLEPVDGRRVFFATTAPPVLLPALIAHLEAEHGCEVVAASSHLSDRLRLSADLAEAAGTFDMLLTELKAAAIDVVAEVGDAAGVPTVLCDNTPLSEDATDLEEALRGVAALALVRGRERFRDATR